MRLAWLWHKLLRMTKDYKTACIFGGTGFIGRQIVRELAKLDIRVKVASRIPEKAYFLRPCGAVGQIVPFACDYSDDKSIQKAVQGCDYVVNCIGILFEKKKGGFQRAHVDLPASIAKACKNEGVEHFVHLSALGVENNESKYGHSKVEGEQAVLSNFPDATILKPSVVFGQDDDFFNKFASLAPIMPFLPLIGGGHTKFQPVFVGDVSDAAIKCLIEHGHEGKAYELGGPDVVSFKEIYEIMFSYTKQPRPLVNLPWSIAKIQAGFLSLLPDPLLTPDQVKSLKSDNVVSDDALKFSDLGISPKAMEIILPTYLTRYQPGGRFADVKKAS